MTEYSVDTFEVKSFEVDSHSKFGLEVAWYVCSCKKRTQNVPHCDHLATFNRDSQRTHEKATETHGKYITSFRHISLGACLQGWSGSNDFRGNELLLKNIASTPFQGVCEETMGKGWIMGFSSPGQKHLLALLRGDFDSFVPTSLIYRTITTMLPLIILCFSQIFLSSIHFIPLCSCTPSCE